jgi:hypothetical protein
LKVVRGDQKVLSQTEGEMRVMHVTDMTFRNQGKQPSSGLPTPGRFWRKNCLNRPDGREWRVERNLGTAQVLFDAQTQPEDLDTGGVIPC